MGTNFDSFGSLGKVIYHFNTNHDYYAIILFSKDKLIWHDGCIPEDKIWVKVGGDHGGGYFKFSFQVGNVLHVNSVRNTFPICCFEAADSVTNLNVALGRYREEIEEITSNQWR